MRVTTTYIYRLEIYGTEQEIDFSDFDKVSNTTLSRETLEKYFSDCMKDGIKLYLENDLSLCDVVNDAHMIQVNANVIACLRTRNYTFDVRTDEEIVHKDNEYVKEYNHYIDVVIPHTVMHKSAFDCIPYYTVDNIL